MSELSKHWLALLTEVRELHPSINFSDIIYSASSNDICIALSVADKCFEHIRLNTLDETSRSFEDRIQLHQLAMKDAMSTAIDIARRSSDEQRAVLESQLQQTRLEYDSLQAEISIEKSAQQALFEKNFRFTIASELTEVHEEQKRAWYRTIQLLEKGNEELRLEKLDITKKYEELNSKLPHMNMSAIGDIGEEFAQSITEKALNGECEVTSVAKESHSMDILITTPSGFCARQEVKYAKPLKKERDMDKFHRNVETAIENGQINAAMFVSLKAPIPNIQSGSLMFKETTHGLKIPILYLFVQSIPVLTHGVVLLKKIQELCKLEHAARGSEPMPMEVQKAQQERIVLKELIPEILTDIDEEKNSILLQLEHIHHIKEISQTRLAKIQLQEQIRDKLKQSIPWIFENANLPEDLMTKAIQTWEEQRDKDGKDPTNLKAFGANKVYIERAGGIVYVKKVLRLRRKDNKRARPCELSEEISNGEIVS